MRRSLAIAFAAVLLLGSGLVHGLWTERWGTSQALADAAAKVPDVPFEIHGWIGESLPPDTEAFTRAGAQAYWSRNYRHESGKSVTVILMCGRAGRMAIHTPEVCYRGIGYETTGAVSSYTIADTKSAFRTAEFVREQGTLSRLRILWSWHNGQTWQAPANPRWHFRGEPYLYKLYIVREVAGDLGSLDNDPAVEFLRELIPALERSLGSQSDERRALRPPSAPPG